MKFVIKNIYIFLVLLLVLQLVLLVNLKFTAWPEMTLWPWLITKGWLPYRDIAIAHTPFMLVFVAAVYKIFGTGILQLKIFTWILILGMDGLLFWIVRKIWSVKTAIVAVATFAFWQPFFDGNGLWFDLFMSIFILASYYFAQKKSYFWVGIFWALAFVSKQTAIWFILPIGLEIVNVRLPFRGNPLKVIRKFVLGTISVLIPFVLIMWLFGFLGDFWNWAVKFGIFILPKAQGQIQLPNIKNIIVSAFPFLIFIPFIGKTGKKNINLMLWAIAGVLGAYPRFEYFHFQPAIPFLAIASGVFFTNNIWKKPAIRIFAILYLLGCLYLFSGFFMRNFKEGVRFYEADVRDLVTYVKNNTSSGDKIFVMNWWDNIYALSDRLPAVDPWVPQLAWYMDLPNVQEKMIEDLTSSRPKLIILNQYSEAGLSAYIPQKVYNYVTANYKFKEKVDGIEILVPEK